MYARLVITLVAMAIAGQAEATSQTPKLTAESDRSFDRPHDLVLSPDGRFLYVADNGNHRVAVLNPETLETVGAIGLGALNSPHDVAFDEDGRLLVADSGNDRVAVYRVAGATAEFIEEWTGGINSPEGIASAGAGRVYVTDTVGGALVSFQDGKPVARSEAPPGDKQGYARPHDVMIDSKGRVIVVDSSNHRIVILDRELKLERVLTRDQYGFNEPKYLAEGPDGRFYLADEYNDRIVIFDSDWRLEIAFGQDFLNQPEGATVRGDRLWIADTYNNRILLFGLR